MAEERKVNIVESVLKTIDDFIDATLGGRPLERAAELIKSLAPANVARKLGLPAPGDIPDRIAQEINTAIRTGSFPRPPTPEELRRMFGR